MKTFRYELGHKALATMTVAELRAKLAEFPDDMPVLARWEGQRMPVGCEFEVEGFSAGFDADRCECLVIDVENSL